MGGGPSSPLQDAAQALVVASRDNPTDARALRCLVRAIQRRQTAGDYGLPMPTTSHDLVGIVLQYMGSTVPSSRPLMQLANRLQLAGYPSLEGATLVEHAALRHPSLRLSEIAVWAPALQRAVDDGQGGLVRAITLRVDAVPDIDDVDASLRAVLPMLPHLNVLVVRGPRPRRRRRHARAHDGEWSDVLGTVSRLPPVLSQLHLLRCALTDVAGASIVRAVAPHSHTLRDLGIEFVPGRPHVACMFDNNFLDQILGNGGCDGLRVLRLAFPEECGLFRHLQAVGGQGLACAGTLETLSIACDTLDYATWQRLVAPCTALQHVHIRLENPWTKWIRDPPPAPFPWRASPRVEWTIVTTDELGDFWTKPGDTVARNLVAYLPPGVANVHLRLELDFDDTFANHTNALADRVLAIAGVVGREFTLTVNYHHTSGTRDHTQCRAHQVALCQRLHAEIHVPMCSVRLNMGEVVANGDAGPPISEREITGARQWHLVYLPPQQRVRQRGA